MGGAYQDQLVLANAAKDCGESKVEGGCYVEREEWKGQLGVDEKLGLVWLVGNVTGGIGGLSSVTWDLPSLLAVVDCVN